MFLFRSLKLHQKDKTLYFKLIQILGFRPKSLYYYKQAFRHSSIYKSSNKVLQNNERLEFIGDAIISSVVSDILFNYFPKANEGQLTIVRAQIVNRKSLNKIAKKIKIVELLEYDRSTLGNSNNLNGNAFEAIVGAIYYDRGYKYCVKFLNKVLVKYFDLDKIIANNTNFKSELLDFVQKHKQTYLFETVENIEKNEKKQHFITEICINNRYITSGKGWSKKEAEQEACQKALNIISNNRKTV